MKASFIVLVATAALCVGCVSAAPPQQRMEAVRGGLSAAEAVDATKVPNAALYLQLAREETEKAQALMEKGKNDRADYVLRRAQADAELAIALAKNAPILKRCEDTKQELEKIKAQNTGSPN